MRNYARAARNLALSLLPLLVFLPAGCNLSEVAVLTASRGGDVAGQQGNLRVVFFNNTPFRAIFTAGTYNNFDQNSSPTIRQFGATAAASLEGNSNSTPITLPCDREFSVGGSTLLRLLEANNSGAVTDPDAVVFGVFFSGDDISSDQAALPTAGSAPPLIARLGVDFPCGALLIVRFEFDDVGAEEFRMDFSVIPPADDDRGT